MTFGCNLNAFLSWKLTDMKYERFLDSRSRLYCYLGYLLRDLFSQACCTIYIYTIILDAEAMNYMISTISS